MAGKKRKNNSLLPWVLMIFGLMLILDAVKPKERGISASFASEPVKVEIQKRENKNAELPTRVVVPKLTIDLQVKSSKVINGFWEVFADSAAWGEGSGYPGERGNQVIFAHAREGLFLPLKDIKEGERILVLTATRWYEYRVSEIKEVWPSQVEVIAPSADERLTLYTCSGYKDSKRLIVIAKRV